jgi:hypothetical protein
VLYKRKLEVFKWIPLPDDVVCQPILSRDDRRIGSVLSPYKVRLMKVVKLRQEEGISLLILGIPVL